MTDEYPGRTMSNQEHKRLEELIDRELRQLPGVPAPPTLVHRVMLAAHARAQQPWWKRSWAAWPTPMRLLFLVGATSFACLCIFSLVYLGGEISLASVASEVAGQLAFLRPIWEITAALAGAAVWLVRAASPLLLWSVILVLGAIYATSVGLGTLCWRVALNRV